MSDKLQQAIQATRAGDTKNAQFLLTQAIQENPDNPQSWYLLSLLVDDKEKKQGYLTKVIELDPDHTKAHEQLVVISETAVPEIESTEDPLPEAATVVLSSGSSDLEAQDEGDTLPDWMADDLPPTEDKDEEDEETVIETVAIVEEEVVPDWLEGNLDEDWDGEEKTALDETVPDESEEKEDEQPEEKTVEEKKEIMAKDKKPAKAKSEKQLNYMLIGLIVVAIIIFFIMAYIIFTM